MSAQGQKRSFLKSATADRIQAELGRRTSVSEEVYFQTCFAIRSQFSPRMPRMSVSS